MNLNIYYLCHFIPNIADTHIDYVNSIVKYSNHNLRYLEIANNGEYKQFIIPELEKFDVIFLHHNLNLYSNRLPQIMIDQIKSFHGLKIYFAQDEYTTPERCARHLAELGIDAVYGCAGANWRDFWDEKILPDLLYKRFLPGYAPDVNPNVHPEEQRTYDIVYRGSHLGHLYGHLGFEKYLIGYHFKKYASSNSLKVDIEWNRDKQIYGDQWLKFLSSGKATLVTESGSSLVHKSIEQVNVLQETKEIMLSVDSPEEYFSKIEHLRKYLEEDGQFVLSTASQKIFEAALCRTAIIGFEGNYADVLKPDVNFIPIKKDFSNIQSVVEKIQDSTYLASLTQKAYDDLIGSQNYSYKNFVHEIDITTLKYFNLKKFIPRSEKIETVYFSHGYKNVENISRLKTIDLSHLLLKKIFTVIKNKMSLR